MKANRPSRLGPSGILLVALVAVASLHPSGTCAEEPGAQDNPSPTLEARIVEDSAGCPLRVEVWVHGVRDTLRGIEATLHWDRPDYVRFETRKTRDSSRAQDTLAAAIRSNKDSGSPTPVVDLSEGLIHDWEYVEARGADGLTIKVTGLAFLLSAKEGTPIPPVETGLLFSLPLALPSSPARFYDGDSTAVAFSPAQTRLSDNRGRLMSGVRLIPGTASIRGCQSVRSPER